MEKHVNASLDILVTLQRKLFEDGGNFNNEEYKFFQKELISCKKLIDRAAIISTSKLEKTIKGIISELEQKKNKILYHTDGILHVVKFHEEISLTLDRCKISIEQLINKLYDETKEFAVNVINLTETDISYSQQNIPVSPLVNDWLSVLSMSGDRMEDLKIPVPAVRIPINGCYNFKDVRSNGEFQSKSKRQNISKSLTNYMNVLFGSNDLTLDGNHFASIVMNIIWSTFIRIQEKAMSFFSSVKEPKQISDSMYHDLMQKTVLRLHCYLLQTEDVWIKKLAENLRIYEVLKQYTANWILKCVEYFNKMHIVPIMSKKKHMITTVENMIKEGFTRRDKVLESLKVSHGYPGHRNSSETLVGNLRKNEQILCDNIKLTFEQYKVSVKELHQIRKMLFNKFYYILSQLLDILFHNIIFISCKIK
ncbi:uncharacterized protein LOC105703909 isoform X2 [Orussus abietinus]|nr:uncharacterized protein LOC105703909 isoform X2 [Orussus abietinus]XP_023287882.1 uncharacterized protein LOC105703909 isoform X2 [Orussus abietinus]XP_023287883.1 uncharacterized protein LOC105703909 isoform X2 [Orussus abietinus]